MKKSQCLITMHLMLAACLFCFTLVYAQNTQTLIIQPGPEGKDTYVCDCLPNVNNPNGPITNLYQGQYGACFDRILIRWDLSSLPKNSSITSAMMELKCNTIYGSVSGHMVYYLLTGEWDETKVTCTSLPGHSSADSVVTNWPAPGQWHSIDITKFVQKWIKDTATNYGVYGHCAGTTGQSDCEFNSSDASTSANRPKLTITYTATTAVEHSKTSQPFNFQLNQNYPNPFNPLTTIQYGLPSRSSVRLVIYNVLGQIVKELVNTQQKAGIQSVVYHPDGASGIYFYRLEATSLDNPREKFVAVKKMLVLQ